MKQLMTELLECNSLLLAFTSLKELSKHQQLMEEKKTLLELGERCMASIQHHVLVKWGYHCLQ
jgi:hypothetical protein